MADNIPQPNIIDIDDTNGPVDTIVDGIKTRLMVDAKVDAAAGDGGGCPVFSKKYRSLFDGATLVLSVAYQTRYIYSGSGKFVGFVIHFSGSDVVVKLSIDSEVIFELNGEDVNDMQIGNPASIGPNAQPTAGGPSWETTGKRIAFSPACPIAYATEVKIEVKRIGNNIDINRSMVALTKET